MKIKFIKQSLRFNFKTKLFLSVSFLFLCIALLVSLSFSAISLSHARQNEKNSSQILLERISSQVETLYSQMDIAATSITKNNTLKKIILDLNIQNSTSPPPVQTEDLQQMKTIQAILGNMMFSPDISNVLLYNRTAGYFYYTGIYLSDKIMIQEALDQDPPDHFFDQTGKPHRYLPPHQSTWTRDDRIVLSAIRNFTDIPTTENTVVEVQVPYSRLESICNQKSFGTEKQILIMNQDMLIIYPYPESPSILSDSQIDISKQKIGRGTLNAYSDSAAYYTKPILNNEFYVILISNNQSLKEYKRMNLCNTVIAVFFVLISACLVMLKVISVILKPLKQLISRINAISSDEDATLASPDECLNEFELISDSLNQMLSKLKESIKKTYEAQIRESNANFAALQAQINPHFLYNALNSISAAGEVYGSEVTTRMCQCFSSMMRYITSSSQEATLIDEISHTKNYLDFMKISYDGSFDYQLTIPLELYHIKIPRLTIQPLVENSFKHGFKECLPPWFIEIRVRLEGRRWIIEIIDNGTGFSSKALAYFKAFQSSYSDSEEAALYQRLEADGLGLRNIYGRLCLYYKKPVKFNIENIPGGRGCRITINEEITDDSDYRGRRPASDPKGLMPENRKE